MKAVLFFLLITSVVAERAVAQVTPLPRGYTTLVMGADVGNGVKPADPGSRVRVPPYEFVRLLAPTGWPYPIQWTKDNKPIAGATGSTLVISLATSTDAGRYEITGAPFPFITTGIALDVAELGHLGNFSTLVEILSGRPAPIVGYVVSGHTSKSLLIRAVGPSLSQFGITDGAPRPRIRIFDGAGKELQFVHPAVVIDWPAIYRSIGAFSLNGSDAIEFSSFAPGAYTIHVSDTGGQSGRILLEVYELPTVSPTGITAVPIP